MNTMKTSVVAMLLAASSVLTIAAAQSTAPAPLQQTIVRAGSIPSSQGPAQNFIGKVRVDPVFTADADSPYSTVFVTFEPGARSAWHTHPGGQRFVVTAGVGRTGVWDGPVVEIKAGDAVWCSWVTFTCRSRSPASSKSTTRQAFWRARRLVNPLIAVMTTPTSSIHASVTSFCWA